MSQNFIRYYCQIKVSRVVKKTTNFRNFFQTEGTIICTNGLKSSFIYQDKKKFFFENEIISFHFDNKKQNSLDFMEYYEGNFYWFINDIQVSWFSKNIFYPPIVEHVPAKYACFAVRHENIKNKSLLQFKEDMEEFYAKLDNAEKYEEYKKSFKETISLV